METNNVEVMETMDVNAMENAVPEVIPDTSVATGGSTVLKFGAGFLTGIATKVVFDLLRAHFRRKKEAKEMAEEAVGEQEVVDEYEEV